MGALLYLVLVTPSIAQPITDPSALEAEYQQGAPRKLAELDAWKFRALEAERVALEERRQRVFVIHEQVKGERDAKARALSDAIDAAAKAAGVDPKEYAPDLERGAWRKREPGKP